MKNTICFVGVSVALFLLSCSSSGDSNGNGVQQSTTSSFHVVYIGNGNDSGAVPVDPREYPEGSTVTVLGNSQNLAKTGNTFAGWNTTAKGDGTSYSPGSTFVIGASDVSLFGVWTINTPPNPTNDPGAVPTSDPPAASGGATVSVTIPTVITVSITVSSFIPFGSDLTASATVSSSVDSYAWYIDGTKVPGQIAQAFSVSDDLERGSHTLMVVVSKDGLLYSASSGFTVR